METEKLRVMLAAADHGSLSKAAELLGYTQSGVTQMMNALEREVGFPLLVRGNRGVRLSSDGERLAPMVRELVAEAERLEQEFALTRGMESGRLSIGTYSSMSLNILPGVLEMFQSRFPGIDLEVLEGNGQEIDEWLSTGRVDLAYTSLQPHYSNESVVLMQDPLYAVLPKSHPMAGAEKFPIEQFASEPFLVYTSATHLDDDLGRAMKAAGISPKARFSSNFDYTIIAMVEHNLGVTIMPELILRGRSGGVATVPIDPPMSRTLCIAVRSMSMMTPAMERFIQCTKEVLARQKK